MMFDYFREAMKEAQKMKELDRKKKRLLSKEMDYAFLEELIVKINENPNLHIKVMLKDGTTLDVDAKPKKRTLEVFESQQDFMEVR